MRFSFAFLLVLATGRLAAAPPITAAAFSPDGTGVVLGSQAGLTILSWPELKPQGRIETQLAHVHDLAFAPAGNLLAAVGGSPGESGSVELIRWPERTLLVAASPHQDLIYSVAWRGDAAVFAIASEDRSVILQGTDLSAVSSLVGHSRGVLAVCFLSHDRMVSAGRDHSLRLWDTATGMGLRAFDNHTGPVVGLAVRPGLPAESPPQVASISSDRTLRLWQPTVGRLMRFVRLASEPLAVSWTADGSRVLASCADGHVRVIDPETVTLLRDIAVLDGWAYTLVRAPRGGQFLVAGQDGRIAVLEVAK